MSWSIQISPVPKNQFTDAVKNVQMPDYLKADDVMSQAMAAQVEIAKIVAVLIGHQTQGPLVGANMSGHANGTGWDVKAGYAADSITVNVYQVQKQP